MSDPATSAFDLVNQVKPFFAGKDPAIQGAALAELASLWLAGHPENVREQLLAFHVGTIRDLTKLNAKKLRAQK